MTELKAYEAFTAHEDSRLPRFRVVDSDGQSYGCSYAHLLGWELNSPPTLLTLTTVTNIFVFEGKNLGKIESPLMEGKIKELRVFNEKNYKIPADNKPIIEELTVVGQS